MLRVHQQKDYKGMSCKVARLIAAQITMKPDCVLGLATGSTPIGAYEELVTKYNEEKLSFAAVTTVNLDEYRTLPPTHEQSYRYFMNDNLFRHVDVREAYTNVPNGLAEDTAAECARYDALIRGLGGIDLQLLGLGNNGHIGFNEPCDHFVLETNVVDLTESTIDANTRFFATKGDVPRQAITMGLGCIMEAKMVLVAVSGAGKADIVCRAFSGPVTPEVPASILQLHPNVVLVGDEAALAALTKTGITICR